MGKSNRIKHQKSIKPAKTPTSKSKSKGMPGWLMTLLTVVITVAILATVAIGLLSSNGVFGRMSTAMKSDHYRVSKNMMTYYFNTQYQNFYNNYQSYLSYFSLDVSKPLQNQTYGQAAEGGYAWETSFLGAFEGTWYDYFLTQTKTSVSTLLVYCEEADARGIELTKEDKEAIDATIESMKQSISGTNYTLDSYLSMAYGEGVKESDVRKALKLSTLASKCQSEISNELNGKITDEDINSEYTNNLKEYNVVDYYSYTFTVKYDDVAADVIGKDKPTDEEKEAKKDEILQKYKEEIAEAKANADSLKAITDPTEFKNFILTYLANEEFESSYKSQDIPDTEIANEDTAAEDTESGDNSSEDTKITKEKLATIKKKLVETVIAEVLDGKDSTQSDATTDENQNTLLYGEKVSKVYSDIIEKVKRDVFDEVKSQKDSSFTEEASYSESNDFLKWAYEDGRKANETHTIFTGDGSKEGEITNSDGYYYASAYLLSATPYRLSDPTRNVAYMLFQTEAEAKAAIEALLTAGDMNYETFSRIADEKKALGHTRVENYIKGNMQSSTFDAWIYGDDVKAGDLSATPIKMDDYYAVLYYEAEGEQKWHVQCKATILNDRIESNYEAIEAKYPTVAKDGTLKKLSVIRFSSSSAS